MTLREYRKTHNLSLDQFGALIGRSGATVSRIERGVDRPGWETLERIENVTKGEVTAADIRAVEAA
jgi:transcriptional regulator with XRE-family HTH domain